MLLSNLRNISAVHKQIVTYGASGLIGTTFHYATMFLIMRPGAEPAFATTVGALIGALVNFVGCKLFVFDSRIRYSVREIIRFMSISAVLILVNAIFVIILTTIFYVWISQLFSTLFCFIIGFFLNRSWTFSKTSKGGV